MHRQNLFLVEKKHNTFQSSILTTLANKKYSRLNDSDKKFLSMSGSDKCLLYVLLLINHSIWIKKIFNKFSTIIIITNKFNYCSTLFILSVYFLLSIVYNFVQGKTCFPALTTDANNTIRCKTARRMPRLEYGDSDDTQCAKWWNNILNQDLLCWLWIIRLNTCRKANR